MVLSNVVKRFRAAGEGRHGSFTLGPVDLVLPDGELTVLAGPSGCGKTTLLRLIAGLETPDSGSVSIGGRTVDGVAPHRRNVAMVFQEHALYPHMTVRANLAFPLKMRKVPKAEIEIRVRETAAWLEIGDLLGRRPDQLSGGQQQRVALGRAIIRQPQVSLLDEPLAHLDTQLRLEMRDMLARLQRRLGLTMLHVTHDQAEAAAMADRIVVLNQGQIEQAGTAADLYEAPSSRFVAGFFGSPPMNFVEGWLKQEGGVLGFVSTNGFRVPLKDFARKCPMEPAESEVTLGVRPQDIVLGERRADRDTGSAGRVESVEPFDGRWLVRLKFSGHDLRVRCDDEVSLAPGEHVAVSMPVDRVFLFERKSGRRY